MTLGDFVDLDGEAAAFSPAAIHSHQHFCPVLSVSSTCPRVQFHDGIRRVILTRQKALQLQLVDVFREGLHGRAELSHESRVGVPTVHGFGNQLDENFDIIEARPEGVEGINVGRNATEFRRDVTRNILVIPQMGISCTFVEFGASNA